MSAGDTTRTIELDGHQLELSNLDKPYFPGSDISKGDVVDYYRRIAPTMLPHVVGKPLVLQRFPDGIDADGFFQKNTPGHVPDWIRRVEMKTSTGGSTSYAVIDGAAGQVVGFAWPARGRRRARRRRRFRHDGDRDVFQNAIAKHTVAPYSLRALTRAPIAAPLHWDEALDASFHPQRITHDDIFRRLGQLDDPWAHVEPPSATIADAIDALDAQ